MTASKTGAENKITALEQKEQELQAFIQKLSIDLQKVSKQSARSGPRFLGFMNGVKTNSLRNFRLKRATATCFSCSHIAPVPGLTRLHSDGSAHAAEQGLLKRRDHYCTDGNSQSTPFDFRYMLKYYMMDPEHKKT